MISEDTTLQPCCLEEDGFLQDDAVTPSPTVGDQDQLENGGADGNSMAKPDASTEGSRPPVLHTNPADTNVITPSNDGPSSMTGVGESEEPICTAIHENPRQRDYFALNIPSTGTKPHSRSPLSRPASGPTSSSTLAALAEMDGQGSPRSERRAPSTTRSSGFSRNRRISHSKSSSASLVSLRSPNSEHPVYPDQSFASLHNHFNASQLSPKLQTRSSHPSPNPFYTIASTSPREGRYRPGATPNAKTAGNTPISSPGLFSPMSSRPPTSEMSSDDQSHQGSPLLHPAHTQKPKVTHTAEIDRDLYTGNKYVNEYEILGELGRGEHGKVKLGRRLGEEWNVAIKIVPRYSKKRRLGKLGAPEDDTKREVAVLKKARHPNVVSLLEVIDDPKKNKVYLVLEYVEKGEIKWRKPAPHEILSINNLRITNERKGLTVSLDPTDADLRAVAIARRQQERRDMYRPHQAERDHFSFETGAGEDENDIDPLDLSASMGAMGRQISRTDLPSRTSLKDDHGNFDTPPVNGIYGGYPSGIFGDAHRTRAMSVADSEVSHMSSEVNLEVGDPQYGHVPALTFEECRRAFRDTLLGLEFLHYLGIIHRDIKPMNLLRAKNDAIKISDFGVSYLGRPVSDEEEKLLDKESDAEPLDDEKELAKSVGTPGFWAPELCYDISDQTQVEMFENEDGSPKITPALDLWSLGVTLYCMVYARVPFYTEDESGGLYESICKSDVFLPKTRLVPVDTGRAEFVTRPDFAINFNKRSDFELKFELVPDRLRDLIRRLLIKDPTDRITIAQAKQHAWVLEGVDDPKRWAESLYAENRKNKADIMAIGEKDMSHAVVKRSIVERAISGVTRIAGNVFGRRDTRSRGRSTTTSHSNSSDSIASPSSTSTVGRPDRQKESRRTSLRGDEMVAAALKASRDPAEHPLAQSQSASPDGNVMPSYFSDAAIAKASSLGPTPGTDNGPRPRGPDRAASAISTAESVKTIRASQPLQRASIFDQSQDVDTSHLLDAATRSLGFFSGTAKRLTDNMRGRERKPGSERSSSATRNMSDSELHGEPTLAVSTASALGDFEAPDALRSDLPTQKIDSSPYSPTASTADRRQSLFQSSVSSDQAFEQAQAINIRRQVQEQKRAEEETRLKAESNVVVAGCPPSPDDITYVQKPPTTRPEISTSEMQTRPSSSTIASSEGFGTSSFSQSISNPSIGITSGASSPPNDGYLGAPKEQHVGYGSETLPEFMRTAETITAHNRPAVATGKALEQQMEYDDGDDEEDCYSSDDDGIVMMGGLKKN